MALYSARRREQDELKQENTNLKEELDRMRLKIEIEEMNGKQDIDRRNERDPFRRVEQS